MAYMSSYIYVVYFISTKGTCVCVADTAGHYRVSGRACLYVAYTLWPHASSWEQMMCDPVNKCANVGVDAGLVLLAAAVSPAHHTDNIVGPVALAHQRAARVPLQGRRGGFHQGSPPLFFITIRRKKNHTLSHKPGRNRRPHSCCLHRTCCHPASLRTRGGLYISPGRSGRREHPAAGWYRTSLRQEERQLNCNVQMRSIWLKC